MISNFNPWESMKECMQRRVDSENRYDLFWITDYNGNYGFQIISSKKLENMYSDIKLKNIEIIKRNSNGNGNGNGEYCLILTKKSEWEIFYLLCKDIADNSCKQDNEDNMIANVEMRLNRWQQLLKINTNKKLTTEIQMGLFCELYCLKELINTVGASRAVQAWVGADFDKQDFLLDNLIIEVKSYKITKGEIVHISSLEQLYSPKKQLFLLAFGVTFSENGLSIKEICEEIYNVLRNESQYVLNQFDNKLIAYGYIPEFLNDPLEKFIVDSVRNFNVSELFPKIIRGKVADQIVNVKYTIDLAKCMQFEVDVNTALMGGLCND